MRLWHYKLIPVLPKKMLVAQWRELIAIKRQWEKETLIHPLVSYVKDNKDYFAYYTHHIYLEMLKRDIKCKDIYMDEIINFCKYRLWQEDLNYEEHNDDYLTICYYNLKEKSLRGIINQEEWNKIEELYKEEI